MEKIIKSNIQNKIVLFCFSIFIFFFDFLKDYFDFRIFIFIPFLIAIYRNFLRNHKKIIFFYFIVLCLLIFQGQIIDINLYDRFYNLNSVIFFIICSYTIWHYADEILKNINLIFNFFLFFFSVYIFFYTLYFFDLHKQYHQCYIGCFSILNNNLKFFSENSHLGFVSTSLISYFIIKIKKIDKYLFFTVLFFIFLLFNFSLTTFLSLFLILIYFGIFYFKNFNFFQKIIIWSFILVSFYVLNNTDSSKNKLNHIFNINNWSIQKKFIDNINTINDGNENKEKKFDENLNNLGNEKDKKNIKEQLVKNLSSEVYIVSLAVTKNSIYEKPFGYGFNNYHLAFSKYIDNIYFENQITKTLNIRDASNNLAKIVTEFGLFCIFFFFVVSKFLFSKKISYEIKFLIFPALFTQTLIRGAGYFNGGFILFFILSLYLIYKKNLNFKKFKF